MTAQAWTVPYNRVSPLYLPRRDMVLDAADSLSLAITIVESDDPDATLINLATGPTYPDFLLRIWPDSRQTMWDYGATTLPTGSLLAQLFGVVSTTTPGTVDFTVPAASMAGWPLRCGFSIRMDHDGSLSETLIAGTLHLRGARSDATVGAGGFFTLDNTDLGALA